MKTIGIIMNGVTGRMGTNQHLVRSILAIRKQGGVELADGTKLMPEPDFNGAERGEGEGLGGGAWGGALDDGSG